MPTSDMWALLAGCPLFTGIEKAALLRLFTCLQASEQWFDKNSNILSIGDRPRLGLILSGRAHIIREDYWGNRSVLGSISHGDLFAEAFCLAGTAAMPVAVRAEERVRLLFLSADQLRAPCDKHCVWHTRLIENMNAILAAKNVQLTGKIAHMSAKTTRDKPVSYTHLITGLRWRRMRNCWQFLSEPTARSAAIGAPPCVR